MWLYPAVTTPQTTTVYQTPDRLLPTRRRHPPDCRRGGLVRECIAPAMATLPGAGRVEQARTTDVAWLSR
jgi:hypothetical protein